MASVDEVVARWRTSPDYVPRPPRPAAEREAFLRAVEAPRTAQRRSEAKRRSKRAGHRRPSAAST
ncbi:MAG: hypothetical protein ABMA64_42020, partial [Myxococcota bacterium]